MVRQHLGSGLTALSFSEALPQIGAHLVSIVSQSSFLHFCKRSLGLRNELCLLLSRICSLDDRRDQERVRADSQFLGYRNGPIFNFRREFQ